mmetsp:Transcript_41120/g.87591  ORF Transcript_41120/g.87591 Transcript_41120/m.87591 type:complete len:193 (-) Transcript_41120:54-632(-)
MSRGTHDAAKKIATAQTFSERMQGIGYNSATWSCAEDEKFGREKLAAAHSRQGLAKTKAMFSGKEVDMEQEAAARDSANKQKRKLDSEVTGFLEEAQSAGSSQQEAKIPKPMPAKAKPEAKPNKMPKLSVVVKKKQETEAAAETSLPSASVTDTPAAASSAPEAAAAPPQAVASGGLGLGGYGSSSEEEDEE